MSLSWYDGKATQGTHKYIRFIYPFADIRDKKVHIINDESCSGLTLRLSYPLHVYVDN